MAKNNASQPPKSKLEIALAEDPKSIERSEFERPGEWASALMNSALSTYEDYFRIETFRSYEKTANKLLTSAEYAKLKSQGPKLRRLILEQMRPDPPEIDWDSFILPEALYKRMTESHDEFMRLRGADMNSNPSFAGMLQEIGESLPAQLTGWAHWKRIYPLSQASLDLFSTARNEFSFADIPWPFPNFVLEFPKPLTIQTPTRSSEDVRTIQIEAIMVMKFEDENGKNWVDCTLLTSRNPEGRIRELLSPTGRELLERVGQNATHTRRAAQYYIEGMRKANWKENIVAPAFQFYLDEPVVKPDLADGINTMRRLLANFLLYFVAHLDKSDSTLSSQSKPDSKIKREAAREVPFNESNIFEVYAESEYPSGEKQFERFFKGRKSPIPHPRAAHDRTIRGKDGQYRVIRIKETFIHKDRQDPDKPFSGSAQKVE